MIRINKLEISSKLNFKEIKIENLRIDFMKLYI